LSRGFRKFFLANKFSLAEKAFPKGFNRKWQSDKTGPGFIVFGVKFDLIEDKIVDAGSMA
jgi:hypothetical protein